MMRDRKLLFGVVGVAAVAILAGAGVLYYKMSSRVEPVPGMQPHPVAGDAPAGAGNAVPRAAVPSIEAAAEGLAQRLKAKDGTADEWALLARSYVQMRRFPEAVDAFAKALQKAPGDQALLTEQAAARKAAGEAAPAK